MFHDLYKSRHQLVITGDDNGPTESSHDDIILRPDVSTKNQKIVIRHLLCTEEEVSHGVSSVVSDDTGVFILLLCHFGEILNGYVYGISDLESQHHRYKSREVQANCT